MLVRYYKDGEGKGEVLKIGEKCGSSPNTWEAMLDLHAELKRVVEMKRGNSGGLEESMRLIYHRGTENKGRG